MIRVKSMALACVLVLGFAASANAASSLDRGFDYNEGPTGGEMFADAVVVRPLTLGASAVGLLAWVVTLPFSIPAGNADENGKAWVTGPLKYTFMRPIGNMEEGVEPSYVQDGR